MSAPLRSRPGSRSHAHVGFLIILALLSLIAALGLYALGQVEVLEPQLGEHQRRQEAAAEQPRPPAAAE